MNVIKVKSSGPPALKSVPPAGAPSAVGHRPPKFRDTPSVRPKAGSTRNYGKAQPPSPNPFGFDGGI